MRRNREQDMEILAQAFFDNLVREERMEYGGWGLDDKRPFGNSDVETDILEMLKAEPEGDDGEEKCYSREQNAYATGLYDSLGDWLKAKWKERRP